MEEENEMAANYQKQRDIDQEKIDKIKKEISRFEGERETRKKNIKQIEKDIIDRKVSINSIKLNQAVNTFLFTSRDTEENKNSFKKFVNQQIYEVTDITLRKKYLKIFSRTISRTNPEIDLNNIDDKTQDQINELWTNTLKDYPLLKQERMIYENPFGGSQFTEEGKLTEFEQLKAFKLNGKFEDSDFAKQLKEFIKNDKTQADISAQYKKNMINFMTAGIIDPINSILKDVYGKTLEEITQELDDVTEDELEQTTEAIKEDIKDKAEREMGESWWTIAKWWLNTAIYLGGVLTAAYVVGAQLCLLGKAQSGCFATDPKTMVEYQTLINNPPQSVVQSGGDELYCAYNKKDCDTITGNPDSSDPAKCTKNCCCNTCNGAVCTDVLSTTFGIGSGSTAQPCATQSCCRWEFDRYGYPNGEFPKICATNPDDPKCQSSRKNWKYNYKCVSGLGALTNLMVSAANAINPVGDMGAIVSTVMKILGLLIGIWIIIQIIERMISK